MLTYQKYLIKNTDPFDPRFFLFIEDDLAAILDLVKDQPGAFKQEILVSSLKNSSPDPAWLTANPGLITQMESGSLPMDNIRSLFQSSQKNAAFQLQLEDYIREQIRNLNTSAR